MNIVIIHNILVDFNPTCASSWDTNGIYTAHIETSMSVFCDKCNCAKISFFQDFAMSAWDKKEAMRKAVEQMANYDWRCCGDFQFGSMFQCQCIGGRYPKGYFKIDTYHIPFAGGFIDQLKELLNELCQTTNAHYEVNQKEIGDGIVTQQIPTLPPGL